MSVIDLAGMSIKTTHLPYGRIRARGFDWSAIDALTDDGAEDGDCCVGYGETEAEAVVDLILDSGEWPDRGDKDAAWRHRLRVVQEWPL